MLCPVVLLPHSLFLQVQTSLEVKNKRTADDAPMTYRQRRRFQAAAFGRKRKWLMAAAGRKRYASGQQKCIGLTEKNLSAHQNIHLVKF
jgi:hypothetical protein